MSALDTNVVVYAISASEGKKEKAARRMLARAANTNRPVAAQVYGEFFALVTRRQMIFRQQARAAIEAFAAVMPALPSTVPARVAASKLAAER